MCILHFDGVQPSLRTLASSRQSCSHKGFITPITLTAGQSTEPKKWAQNKETQMPPRTSSQRSSPLINKAGDDADSPVAALTKRELQQRVSQGKESLETETVRNSAVRNDTPADSNLLPGSSSNNSNLLGPLSSSTLYNPSSSLGLGAGYGNLGLGGFGSAGMLGSPYGYSGMMMPPSIGGPFSGLNQFLFGVQNVIFSLGQAVQIVGMNTQALHHLLESATAMFDHAVATWHEMRFLEETNRRHETEEMKKRRRRLRAVRWAVVTAVVYAGYKLIRRAFRQRYRGRLLEHQQNRQMYSPQTYAPGPYYLPSNQYSQTGQSYTGYGDPQPQMSHFYGSNLSGSY